MIVVEMRTSKSLLHEAENDLLQDLFVHLAVTDAEAGLRHELAELVGDTVDVMNAVVDEVDLPTTVDLAQDDFTDQLILKRSDERANRQARLRRCVDHADVADTSQRHVQGARNWRCAHGEDVDLRPQLLQELLLADAKSLFLIDDDESQLLEADVVLVPAGACRSRCPRCRRPIPQ